LLDDCYAEFFTDGPPRLVLNFLKQQPDFLIKGELDVQALQHLSKQSEMMQSLQDYVKILVLQFEELYADLPLADLEELAQKLKLRLVDRYVKMQNRNITKALDAAKTEEQRLELMKKSKRLNELIK
jgi:uncharacterized protein YigA (DUF484 family)